MLLVLLIIQVSIDERDAHIWLNMVWQGVKCRTIITIEKSMAHLFVVH